MACDLRRAAWMSACDGMRESGAGDGVMRSDDMHSEDMISDDNVSDASWFLPREPVEGDREGWFAAVEYALFRGAVGFGSRLSRPLKAALVRMLASAAKSLD